jgi:hypothetical protein
MDWQRRSSAAWRPSASSSRDFGEIPETRTPEKARQKPATFEKSGNCGPQVSQSLQELM